MKPLFPYFLQARNVFEIRQPLFDCLNAALCLCALRLTDWEFGVHPCVFLLSVELWCNVSAGINIEAWLLPVHTDPCRCSAEARVRLSVWEWAQLWRAPFHRSAASSFHARVTGGANAQRQRRDGLSVGPEDRPGPGNGYGTGRMRPRFERDGGPLGDPLFPLTGTDPRGQAGGD